MKNNIVKFCLITTQRSGSTWLVDLLASNPKIRSYGEVFIQRPRVKRVDNRKLLPKIRYYKYKKGIRPFKIFSYLNYIQNIESFYGSVGFKLMYSQLKAYPEILIHLLQHQYKIIHLTRNNSIDVIISYENMKKSGIAHIKDNSIQRTKIKAIYLNPDKLLYQLKRHKLKVNFVKHFLKILPLQILNVTYEELYRDKEKCLRKIISFLSKEDNLWSYFQSDLIKANPGKHWEKIKNYNEIKKILKGTEFYKYLHLKD